MLRILIPTDFSENAWNAIQYGLALYQNSKCEFHLIHIHPIPPYSGAGSSVRSKAKIYESYLLQESEEKLQALLERISALPFNTDHNFFVKAQHDFFVGAIKRESEERKIHMIIMGTKGASGLKKVALGSNTGDVITKVKCPLLAVPEEAVYKVPREIVFPTDYHISYDVKVLDTLIAMAVMNESTIRVLHISKKGEELNGDQLENQDFLDDYLADVDHTFHSLTGTKLEAAVQCFTESRDVDMIAMVAKSLNFFQRILFRPAVEEISYHTKIPFLVLHE